LADCEQSSLLADCEQSSLLADCEQSSLLADCEQSSLLADFEVFLIGWQFDKPLLIGGLKSFGFFPLQGEITFLIGHHVKMFLKIYFFKMYDN
jgi:hypothetical protein